MFVGARAVVSRSKAEPPSPNSHVSTKFFRNRKEEEEKCHCYCPCVWGVFFAILVGLFMMGAGAIMCSADEISDVLNVINSTISERDKVLLVKFNKIRIAGSVAIGTGIFVCVVAIVVVCDIREKKLYIRIEEEKREKEKIKRPDMYDVVINEFRRKKSRSIGERSPSTSSGGVFEKFRRLSTSSISKRSTSSITNALKSLHTFAELDAGGLRPITPAEAKHLLTPPFVQSPLYSTERSSSDRLETGIHVERTAHFEKQDEIIPQSDESDPKLQDMDSERPKNLPNIQTVVVQEAPNAKKKKKKKKRRKKIRETNIDKV
ncbi:unnamed protein product [Dimorphilus gyrociliatus]|uniref:Uncharacterized protein n=1 Tax=Dimorphilus gyrociliatus TaxID=2664684 RepID=A0A7I8W206_9ANNE|nr:unnamed protein product [Dimorphilus gyrociliatus]